MRAFYRLAVAAWDLPPATPEAPGPQRPANCIELGRMSTSVYLLSATDPNPALDAAAGVRLGARLSELRAADAKRFTATPVQRTVTAPDGSASPGLVLVPTDALAADDVPAGEPVLRGLFAGDDEAELM